MKFRIKIDAFMYAIFRTPANNFSQVIFDYSQASRLTCDLDLYQQKEIFTITWECCKISEKLINIKFRKIIIKIEYFRTNIRVVRSKKQWVS